MIWAIKSTLARRKKTKFQKSVPTMVASGAGGGWWQCSLGPRPPVCSSRKTTGVHKCTLAGREGGACLLACCQGEVRGRWGGDAMWGWGRHKVKGCGEVKRWVCEGVVCGRSHGLPGSWSGGGSAGVANNNIWLPRLRIYHEVYGGLVSWCLNVLVSLCHGTLVSWYPGALVSWCHSIMVS